MFGTADRIGQILSLVTNFDLNHPKRGVCFFIEQTYTSNKHLKSIHVCIGLHGIYSMCHSAIECGKRASSNISYVNKPSMQIHNGSRYPGKTLEICISQCHKIVIAI